MLRLRFNTSETPVCSYRKTFIVIFYSSVILRQKKWKWVLKYYFVVFNQHLSRFIILNCLMAYISTLCTDCGILTNPANGNVDISGGTTYGQTASYECNAGFDLNGVLERTCQADGTWSTAAPTCDRKGIRLLS